VSGRDYARPSVRWPEPHDPRPLTAWEAACEYEAIAEALGPAREAISQIVATQSRRPENDLSRGLLAVAGLIHGVLTTAATECRTRARAIRTPETLTAADAA